MLELTPVVTVVNYSANGDVIPSIVGLARHLGVARSTIYDWTKDADKVEFSNILDKLLSAQERKLLIGDLTSNLNTNNVRFTS